MKSRGHRAALLAILSLCGAVGAGAEGFNQFVAFGDSTVDTGFFRYNPTGNAAFDGAIANAVAHGASGAFVGPGVMNTTMLAGRFGLNADPVGHGGTNYANGGAHTVTDLLPNLSTVQSISTYLASVNGAANPRALYEIRTGDNDLAFVSNQSPEWLAANPNHLSDIASTLAARVAVLQAAGAHTILVPNSYNCAVFAGPGGEIASGNAAKYARSQSFDALIWSDLTAAGIRFVPADIDGVLKYVVKHPALFGFTAESVLSANAPSHTSALLTTSAMITPEQEQTHLFVDVVHLTTAGQRIESDYEYSLLIAPSQISLIVEATLQGGLIRVATIQGQLAPAGQPRPAPRSNVWAAVGGGIRKINIATGFAEDSGTTFGSTVGVDYPTATGLIAGAALSVDHQRLGFSTGGHCAQVEAAISGYLAYQTGPAWGNAIATFGLLQDDVERSVQLGALTDQNNAHTGGRAAALALQGGYDWKRGTLTIGPIAGVVLQNLHLNGFTETGTSGVTALSFRSQTRDSLVSQVGWRTAMNRGRWRVFSEVAWNHEWAAANRDVTVALTSIGAAPYTSAGVLAVPDWASASLGATCQLNSRVMLRAAAQIMIGNPRVTSYGGDLGISVGF